MEGYQHLSLTWDEIAKFKRIVTGDASFSQRISVGFAYRLACLRQDLGEYHHVIFEINHLEQGIATSTKAAAQFKYAPLKPFWHKHFSSSRHMFRNIGERWNISRGQGNRDLDRMIEAVAAEQGHDPDLWPKLLTYRALMGALNERSAEHRITGDWIIFAKYHGQNYYLDLATHEEGEPGDNAERLFKKVKNGSVAEFPFLFSEE